MAGSVFALTVAAGRLGPAALSAHAVTLQLWLVTSFIVDGFADVGTMLSSRLLGSDTLSELRDLTSKLVLLGLGTGLLVAVLFAALQHPLSQIFTRDLATGAQYST